MHPLPWYNNCGAKSKMNFREKLARSLLCFLTTQTHTAPLAINARKLVGKQFSDMLKTDNEENLTSTNPNKIKN